MSFTDFLGLNEHKLIQNVRKTLPKNLNKSVNVLTVKENVLFTWDFENNCVLTLNLKSARSKQGDNVIYQKLLPLSPPLFQPELLVCNESATLLIVSGASGALVFELPTRCPPYGAFDKNKDLVYCRTHSLDERILSCNDNVKVLQAKFHPGSLKDNHVVLLTSDNALRLYIIENGRANNIGIYPVGEKPIAKLPCSKMTFLGALGEIAVDFDFGHPILNNQGQHLEEEDLNESSLVVEKNSKNNSLTIRPISSTPIKPIKKVDASIIMKFDWPIYVLSADCVIITITIALYTRSAPIVKGPLSLFPKNVFQYTKKACSILCLNTTPQTLCVANSSGEILQGIVLPTSDSEDVNVSLNQSSRSEDKIYFFESIEIELGLITSMPESDEIYTCPVFLHKDEANSARYFATHSAGVHTINIQCLGNLQAFFNEENGEASKDIFNIPSTSEYLVCTKTQSSTHFNPVIGFSQFYNPMSILALLANGNLVTLGLGSGNVLPKCDNLTHEQSRMEIKSPMKEMMRQPFDAFIQKILAKNGSQPILKLATSAQPTQIECYELLQNASKMLCENQLKSHTQAKEEIEKRVKALTMIKKYQQSDLEKMAEDKSMLQEKAESLAEKYEEVRDKQDAITNRCENLLVLVTQKKSQLSNAELDFLDELKSLRDKMDTYDKSMEKLLLKKTYQEGQMRNWRFQEMKRHSSINETHVNTIKTNLLDTSEKINEMVDEIKEYKLQLNI